MYFFSATKKGFISLLYLCTRNDDGSMAERSKAAHCSLGDEGDACQSKNVLNRKVPEVLSFFPSRVMASFISLQSSTDKGISVME